MRNRIAVLCLAAGLLGILCSGCNSLKTQSSQAKYPVRPITILVPFTAGGSMDQLARALEKIGYKYLGQPLVVVNRPGGGGTIAWNELVSAKPDGYTIGMTAGGIILQSIYGQSKYNYVTALEPIAKITNAPPTMAIIKNEKWHNLQEFIAYAKEHPGEIKYGHSGLGTAMHVAGEMLALEARIQLEQVPFQGDSEAIAALLGNHIDVIFGTATPLKEYVKSGKIEILAVADDHRLADADFQDIPTFKEQGYNVELSNWQCIAAPKDLPPEVKTKLIMLFRETIEDPQFQDNLKSMGYSVEYIGSEDSIREWSLEYKRLAKVIQKTGIAERIAAQRK